MNKINGWWIYSTFILVIVLQAAQGQEKDLSTLVKGLKAKDDITRKDSLEGLLKRAHYEYGVKELDKRGVVPLLITLLKEENSNPLIKETAVAVLDKMCMHSSQVRGNILESEFIHIAERLVRKGTTTSLELIMSVMNHIAQLGSIQRAKLAGSSALEALLFVLKSGTPVAREKAAALVSELSQDETARQRFAERKVEDLLQRITEIGTANGKKHAANAMRKLQQPILPMPQVKATPAGAFKTSTAKQPLNTQHAIEELLGIDLDHGTSTVEDDEQILAPTTTHKKKKNGFVNNYRLRAPTRSSHI